jgi:phage gpG-like protein
MAKLNFQVSGDKEISRNLRVFVGKLANMSEFYNDAIDIVEEGHDKAFKQGGYPEAWKPLAESTLKARKNRWGYYKAAPSGGGGILNWTGKLSKDKTRKVTNNYGEFEKTSDIAKFHQEGIRSKRGLIKRRLIDLSPQDAANVVRKLQEKINRDIGISGLQY